MHGPIHSLLATQHRDLEEMWRAATALPQRVDAEAYARFRVGLLTHIAAEEKILIPAAKAASQDILSLARKIRAQHGAITALLAPAPSPTILRALRTILEEHNELEEKNAGLYDICEGIVAGRVTEILDRLSVVPDVRVSPHVPVADVIDSVRRILARAGYNLASFEIPPTPRGA